MYVQRRYRGCRGRLNWNRPVLWRTYRHMKKACFIYKIYHLNCAVLYWLQNRDKPLQIFCAAPGGKTFTMAEQMENQGKLLSFDKYKGKVGLIRQGAKRLGLSVVEALFETAAIQKRNCCLQTAYCAMHLVQVWELFAESRKFVINLRKS